VAAVTREVLETSNLDEISEKRLRQLVKERTGADTSLPDLKALIHTVVEEFVCSEESQGRKRRRGRGEGEEGRRGRRSVGRRGRGGRGKGKLRLMRMGTGLQEECQSVQVSRRESLGSLWCPGYSPSPFYPSTTLYIVAILSDQGCRVLYCQEDAKVSFQPGRTWGACLCGHLLPSPLLAIRTVSAVYTCTMLCCTLLSTLQYFSVHCIGPFM